MLVQEFAPRQSGNPQCFERSGTHATTPKEPLTPDLFAHEPVAPFDLDEHIFNRNLCPFRREPLGNRQGLRSLRLFFLVSERLGPRGGRRSSEFGEDHGIVEARRRWAWHCGRRRGEEIGGANDCKTTQHCKPPAHQHAFTTKAGCEWRMSCKV